MAPDADRPKAQANDVPFTATVFGNACPRCGQGRIYGGLLKLAPACSACGLDLGPYDQGDGPAALVVLVVGTIAVGGGLFLELLFEPALWVQMMIWTPLIFGLSLLFLRWVKAGLVHQQYRLKATDDISLE